LTRGAVENKFTKPIRSSRLRCCMNRQTGEAKWSSSRQIINLTSNFVIPYDSAADLRVLIFLLINRNSKLKNPPPDDLKFKIEEYFFLNPLTSCPYFPHTIAIPSSYLVRCLFVLCSMLVRCSIYKVCIWYEQTIL